VTGEGDNAPPTSTTPCLTALHLPTSEHTDLTLSPSHSFLPDPTLRCGLGLRPHTPPTASLCSCHHERTYAGWACLSWRGREAAIAPTTASAHAASGHALQHTSHALGMNPAGCSLPLHLLPTACHLLSCMHLPSPLSLISLQFFCYFAWFAEQDGRCGSRGTKLNTKQRRATTVSSSPRSVSPTSVQQFCRRTGRDIAATRTGWKKANLFLSLSIAAWRAARLAFTRVGDNARHRIRGAYSCRTATGEDETGVTG